MRIDVFPAPNEFEPSDDPLSTLDFACAGLRDGKIIPSTSPVEVERVSRDHALVYVSLAPDLAHLVPLLVVRRMPLIH